MFGKRACIEYGSQPELGSTVLASADGGADFANPYTHQPPKPVIAILGVQKTTKHFESVVEEVLRIGELRSQRLQECGAVDGRAGQIAKPLVHTDRRDLSCRLHGIGRLDQLE